jgi:hypothetical protein
MTPWNKFWNSLNADQRRLFRLLQTAYRSLGKDARMFSYDHLGPKSEIRQYVQDVFGVDLDNLPQDRV